MYTSSSSTPNLRNSAGRSIIAPPPSRSSSGTGGVHQGIERCAFTDSEESSNKSIGCSPKGVASMTEAENEGRKGEEHSSCGQKLRTHENTDLGSVMQPQGGPNTNRQYFKSHKQSNPSPPPSRPPYSSSRPKKMAYPSPPFYYGGYKSEGREMFPSANITSATSISSTKTRLEISPPNVVGAGETAMMRRRAFINHSRGRSFELRGKASHPVTVNPFPPGQNEEVESHSKAEEGGESAVSFPSRPGASRTYATNTSATCISSSTATSLPEKTSPSAPALSSTSQEKVALTPPGLVGLQTQGFPPPEKVRDRQRSKNNGQDEDSSLPSTRNNRPALPTKVAYYHDPHATASIPPSYLQSQSSANTTGGSFMSPSKSSAVESVVGEVSSSSIKTALPGSLLPPKNEEKRGGGAVPSLSTVIPTTGAPPPPPPSLTLSSSNHTCTTTTAMSNKQRASSLVGHNVMARPSLALSVHLMTTYLAINAKYHYERKLGGKYEDESGSLIFVSGTLIAQRYRVEFMLGKGSFGAVFQCVDIYLNRRVAVKVVRTGKYFEMQSKMEARILRGLHTNPHLRHLVANLLEKTSWRGHVVLVFELLSFNLFQLLYQTKFNGVSLDLVRKFTWQLLQVFLQLEQHDPPIIHCDLKPENVSLVTPDRSGIRVIDFGSAQLQTSMTIPTMVDGNNTRTSKRETPPLASSTSHHGRRAQTERGEVGEVKKVEGHKNHNEQVPRTSSVHHAEESSVNAAPAASEGSTEKSTQPPHRPQCFPHYIQSRYYRSPEVILELGYTCAIDRWSLACMLVELHTGRPLFQGRDEAHMLECFVNVLGPIPTEMIERSPRRDHFFALVPSGTNGFSSSVLARQDCRREMNNEVGGTALISDPSCIGDDGERTVTLLLSSNKKKASSAPPLPQPAACAGSKSQSLEDAFSHAVVVSGREDYRNGDNGSFPAPPSANATTEWSKGGTPPSLFSSFTGSGAGRGGLQRSIRGADENALKMNQEKVVKKHESTQKGAVSSPPLSVNVHSFTLPQPPPPRSVLQHGVLPAARTTNPILPLNDKSTADEVGRKNMKSIEKSGLQENALSHSAGFPSSSSSSSSILEPPRSPPTYYLLPQIPHKAGKGKDETELHHHRHHHSAEPHSTTFHPGPPTVPAEKGNTSFVATQEGREATASSSSPPLGLPPSLPLIPMKATTSLEEILGVTSGGPRGCRKGQDGHDEGSYRVFFDFISRLLTYDPSKRMTCLEATQHPFLAPINMYN